MSKGLFSDLLVIELASVLAGPSVGMFFAELGARVVKVENARAKGDVTRSWKLRSEDVNQDRSAYFCSVNWGKDSLSVDLSTPQGQEVVHRLVRQADLVLTSYKAGDAQKLRMDADTLRRLNSNLIYASIFAYGPEDPRPGFDAIIQAEAGFTYMNGNPGGGPVKMPVALMDILAAHQLKEACLLALIHRERTGEGSVVGSGLMGAALASLANQATNYLVAGHVPQRIGSEHPNIVPYGTVFTTRDGKDIVLAVGSDQQFVRLCQVLGIPDLAADPDFVTNALRVKNRERVNAALSTVIATFGRDDLLKGLQDASVPAGAVHDVSEALQVPEAEPLKLEKHQWKGLRTVSFSADFNPPSALTPPPTLGEHSVEILKNLGGYSPEEIEALLEQQIVTTHD